MITFPELLDYINKKQIGKVARVNMWGSAELNPHMYFDSHENADVLLDGYAFYVMWEAGYWWSRSYDENWNDVSDSGTYTPEAEPEFEGLQHFLATHPSDVTEASLEDIIHTTTYCSDEYYGGTTYDVKYIMLADLLPRMVNTKA